MWHTYGSASDPDPGPVYSVTADGTPLIDLSRTNSWLNPLDYRSLCQCSGRHDDTGRNDGRCDALPQWRVRIRRANQEINDHAELLCGNCARHSRAMHRAELFEVDFLDPDQQKAQGKA
ncbi:MAG: hypothetical protein P1U38_14270 [Aeromicrobium sp.]|uniref:hypothetical protein n=1 Tax=Aeromicrobium sp. TaxID=1871063 RepID=UPI00261E1716|nr:hypothetical protein [Aeromicrobium sp.]MDF1705928.1 hypothetical protein [Aeromicrobium sp.]